MLKYLENLQCGHQSAKSCQTSLINQRILNLSLSQHVKPEKFHTNSISTMDVDRIEERYLISGGKDGALCIHDLHNSTGKAVYEPKAISKIPRYHRYSHKYSVSCVQWYPFDTGIFVSSGMDRKLQIWDANHMRPADTLNISYKIHNHHMSPIAKTHSLIAIAMGFPHAVLLDPRSGARCQELRAHVRSVSCVRWSPASEYLLATGGDDTRILLWDIRSAKGYLKSLDQHNGEEVAAQGKDGYSTAHNGIVNGLRFTDDGLYLSSCATDCRLRLWDVALGTNTLVNYGVVISNRPFRRNMDICSNSSPPVLFVPSSNHIFVFDLFSGNRITTLVGHFSLVNCCVYRPMTHSVLSAGSDMNILVWSADNLQEIDDAREAKATTEEDGGTSPQISDTWSSGEEETIDTSAR